MAAPLGNQFAKKAKAWESAIKRALARYSGDSVEAGLDRLADRMVKAAIEGEDDHACAMIAEKIGDRLDGKPAQSLIHTGDDEGGPVKQSIEYHIIEHSPKD